MFPCVKVQSIWKNILSMAGSHFFGHFSKQSKIGQSLSITSPSTIPRRSRCPGLNNNWPTKSMGLSFSLGNLHYLHLYNTMKVPDKLRHDDIHGIEDKQALYCSEGQFYFVSTNRSKWNHHNIYTSADLNKLQKYWTICCGYYTCNFDSVHIHSINMSYNNEYLAGKNW